MGNEVALSAFGAKDLFIHSGIFRWHQCLQRQTGAEVPPARSVFAMAQCLRALPRSWVAKTGSAEDLDLLILELLDRHRDAYAEQPLPPEVQTWGPRDVDWWQPRDLLGQLIAVECGPAMLRNARRRMTERGVRVDYTELHDLAAMFANDYLPSAMRWFNPARGEGKEGAWVTTVFFRYAIPRVLNTARCRVSFDEAFVEADLAVDPEVASEQLQRKVLLDRVASELDALSEPQRTALALYFGLDDRENTLGLVAKAMGHSVQFVRMAIISGLGAMALRLSLGHWSDPEDARVARLFFAEGRSRRQIARQAGMSNAEVQERVQRLLHLFRNSMRTRTVTTKGASAPLTKEIALTKPAFFAATPTQDMATVPWHPLAAVQPEASSLLRQVLDAADEGGPEARLAIKGPDKATGRVQLSHGASLVRFANVEALRQALRGDEQLYNRLAWRLDQGDQEDFLAEVFALDIRKWGLDQPGSRADVSPAQREWSRAVEVSLAQGASLAESFWQGFEGRGPEEAAPETLQLALATVATGLEDEMPWDQRMAGQGILAVWPASSDFSDLRCAWIDGQGRLGIEHPLLALIHQRLDLIGQLPAQLLEPLARHVAVQVATGTVPLPGFEITGHDAEGRCLLQWRTPVIETQPL